MTGNNTLSRNEVRFGGVLLGLLILTALAAKPIAAADITVTDELGGENFVASHTGKITWTTQPTGLGWSSATKLALYASRGQAGLTIATPGTSFTVVNITGGNQINFTADPTGLVNVNDIIVLKNCVANSGQNNGTYIVASVGSNFVTVTGTLLNETVSALAIANPGANRVTGGATTIRTTTAHGLTAFTSYVSIKSTDDTSFSESSVQVTSTPTPTTFTYQATSQITAASTGNGTVDIIPNATNDVGTEYQFITETANTGSLTIPLPNLIGTEVYYYLVNQGDTNQRIRSKALDVRGIQLVSPATGAVVTALETPSPIEITFEMRGYSNPGAVKVKLVLSRDGLFSGGSNDEILIDNAIVGASSLFSSTATSLRGATAAYTFLSGSMVWTAPLTPEARVRVLAYSNTTITKDTTDETGITSGASHDPISGAYIDRAFRIGAGSGPVPMYSPNGGEVIPRVEITDGVQNVRTQDVRYIPLASTVLPVTTVDTGMLLEFSGDSGNTWEPLNRFAFSSNSFVAPFNLTTASFVAPSTINVTTSAAGLAVGLPITVSGTTLNNGTYTVTAVAGTVITVSGAVVNETVAGTVAEPGVINLTSSAAGTMVGSPIAVSGTSLNNGTFTLRAVATNKVAVMESNIVAETATGLVLIGQVFNPTSSRFEWVTLQDPSSRCRLRTRLVKTNPPADIGSDNGAIINDIVDTSNTDFTLRGIVLKGINSSTKMPVGSTQTLRWVSAGSAGRVNIRLSRNGGLTFETIVNNTEDDGSYDWVVTGPVTDNTILYIEQADQPIPYFDRNYVPFTIQGYTVVTPNGGEIFQIGSLQSILWISAGMPKVGDPGNAVDITLTYTNPATNAPTTITIASAVPNNLNYGWTLANTIPGVTDARINIANTATPTVGADLSDNPFTIQRSITVLTPNGGATYVVGEVTPVTWTSTGLPILGGSLTSYVRPELLVGTSIDSIGNGGLARTSNLVTVKTIAAHGYTTGNNILITDSTDTSFNGTFVITVTGANTFTYAQTGVDAISGNGVAYKARRVLGGSKIDSVANTGLSRAANVVTVKTTTNHGYIVGDVVRIVDTSDAGFVGNFTVTAVPTSTTFRFSQVGANTTSGGGATYRSTITAGLLNSGSLNNVWTSDDVAAIARVRVLEVNSTNAPQPSAAGFTNDFSDNSFAIQTFVSEPEAISVTTPNGGESFTLGQNLTINWTSSGQVTRSNTVTIRITRDTTDNANENVIIATNVQNTGAFSWLVTGAPTRSARIVITSDADSNVTDVSDGDFVIKGIQVLAPNGLSDSITVGSPLSISWNFGFTGASDNVKIELSRDGGTSYTTIVPTTPNSGGYLWVSQQPVSATCKVRVTSLGDASLTDNSDATFQLRGITVTSPSGGQTWNQGSLQNVTWTSVSAGNFVDIDLSVDGGASYQRIANHAANNGSIVWTVAQPYSANRLLRTVNFVAATKTINFVTGASLTSIAAGDKITVTGTASNNGLLTVATVGATSLTVTNTLVDETIGVDVTVALAAIQSTPAFSVTRVIKTASFTAGTATITFAASSNLTGIQVGDRIKIAGTVSNNGTFVIASVGANSVTVTTPLVTEAAAIDATVSMQPTNTRIYRTVSIDGAAKSIAFGSGAVMSGLVAGQTITIAAPSVNAGTYTIASVGSQNVVVTGTLVNETVAVDATVTATGLNTYYISQPTAKARIRVTDTANDANRDSSDTDFSIPPVTPSALMFAVAPNPQPPFQFGTTTTVQWNGQGMGATATLEFSSDSGVTYSLVDAAVPNSTNSPTSTYSWTAPNISTATAVLRLTSNVSPNPSITTTGVFTVNAPTVPSLLLTPTAPSTVTFTAVEDGDAPSDQSGTLQNIGAASTNYTLTVPGAATWLTIARQPSSGTASFGTTVAATLVSGATDTILFRASPTGLTPGTYTAVVALTASGGALGVTPFNVTFTVTPAGIGLVTATPVVATVPEGSTTATVVTIQNRTTGTITPTITGLPSWATLSTLSPSTVAPSGTASTTLTLSGVGLAPGVYTATLTVSNSGAAPTRTFTVQFTVTKAGISFENKKKSCSIGSAGDSYAKAAFALPFALLLLGWLLTRVGGINRFFRRHHRAASLTVLMGALVLLGSAPNAQAATIGSAEEGPSLFGLDVRVPTMLHTIDATDVYAVAAINENVPLQDANFGGLLLSSGWVNQNPRGWLPRNMFIELQLGFMTGVGIANIQALTGAGTTKYDARIFNGRFLFAVPMHVDRDEGVRIDDRHPIACSVLASIGYHYILVDFDKTTVDELGRGLEIGFGGAFDYGIMPDVAATFSGMAVGRFQTYNNAFKDSKFNASVEGQFSAGISWQFTPDWQVSLQANGVAAELIDFHRFGGILTLRYASF